MYVLVYLDIKLMQTAGGLLMHEIDELEYIGVYVVRVQLMLYTMVSIKIRDVRDTVHEPDMSVVQIFVVVVTNK